MTGSWDPTARPSTGRPTWWPPARSCSPTTSTHTSLPASDSRRRARAPRPDRPRCAAAIPTTHPTAPFRPSATSSRSRPTRSARSPLTSARSCAPSPTRTTDPSSGGRRWPAPRPLSSFDAHLGGYPVDRARHRVAAAAPQRLPSRRRAGPMDRRNAVPAVVEESRPRHQLRQRQPAAGGAGQPVGLRRLAGITAQLQLEYGAEIGRAIVNFDGPIVFCVISRYHGGAFVVFSGALNDNMEVDRRRGFVSPRSSAALRRPRRCSLARSTPALTPIRGWSSSRAELDGVEGDERASLRVALADLRASVRSNKLGEVAREFDGVHTVERALRIGSIDAIIPAVRLRPH